MSGLVFADLDQRRSKLMEDIETQIRENKSLRAEADRVASTNVIFQKHLQESRQLMVSLTSQITAAEQRKATLDSVIAAEQQRINEARDELINAEDACRKARQECTHAFDTATSDLRQCYINDFNKDVLLAKIAQETEQLQSLRREALMIRASALALNSNAEDEDRLVEQLNEQRKTLQSKSNLLSQQLDILDKEEYPAGVDAQVMQLQSLLQKLDGVDFSSNAGEQMEQVVEMARAIDHYGFEAMVAVLSAMKEETQTTVAETATLYDDASSGKQAYNIEQQDEDNAITSAGRAGQMEDEANRGASASSPSSPVEIICSAVLADGAQCSSSVAGSLITVVDDALSKAQEQSEAIASLLHANP